MSRARTYTKAEISDAAAAAVMHNVRVVMHPNGEIEFAPKSFAAQKAERDKSQEAFERWMANEGHAGGGS
jgi:hypothetical protein